MIPRPLRTDDLDGAARVHAAAFDTPWSAEALGEILAAHGSFGLGVGAPELCGFILCRDLAGEAEILTLAVDPAFRRRGLAQALVRDAIDRAATMGTLALFLEVATDNPAAIGLYEGAGFRQVGLRRGYYARALGPNIDALVMRRDL